MFPIQVIITRNLDSKHSSLRILSDKATKEDVETILEEALQANDPDDRRNIDAVLHVSVSANEKLYSEVRRNEDMCQALRELIKDEFDKEITEAKSNTTLDNLKELMKNLKMSAEQAMQALSIPESEQATYSAMLNPQK